MSKRHKAKPQPTQKQEMFPSAQTVFRFAHLDLESRNNIDQSMQALDPELWARDRDAIRQIEQAKTADEVLEFAVKATGVADIAWFKRVRQFGPDIIPLVAQRLKSSREIADSDHQTLIREHLIGALRWRGTLGANVLVECFASLDDYAQSLAAVVLGLVHARASGGLIWDLFQRTKNLSKHTFVGALWGLIDLQDARAADALVELFQLDRMYYEIFGFVARAGDERAVVPMASVMVHGSESEREQSGYVLAALSHRLGREKFVAAIIKDLPEDRREMAEKSVDQLLSYPPDVIQDYFALFYQGVV